MTEDASLDRFASPDPAERETDVAERDAEESMTGDAEESTTEGNDSTIEDDVESPAAPETADPAVSTFGWSPGGGECAACGASVERRWRADGERGGDLVCADCKEW